MSGFQLSDYVDVAERIHSFYDRYPEGRLVTVDWEKVEVGGQDFILCHAKAFRTPDDPLPGDGLAWEPVPGPTQFTKDSELMNAQTAAWGRAIVALGFETKKLASTQEVQARSNGNGDPLGLQASRADAITDPGDAIVGFGKHKGSKVRDVPASYWEWWLGQDPPKTQAQQELRANVELFLAGATGEIAYPVEDGVPF